MEEEYTIDPIKELIKECILEKIVEDEKFMFNLLSDLRVELRPDNYYDSREIGFQIHLMWRGELLSISQVKYKLNPIHSCFPVRELDNNNIIGTVDIDRPLVEVSPTNY